MSETIYHHYEEIVDSINNSTTTFEHSRMEAYRQGFIVGLQACGFSNAAVGGLIIDADIRQMNKGIDRPMCGGVWLDWEPQQNETP